MIRKLALLLALMLSLSSCGIYSFSGTSIQPDVNTVTINLSEYKALKVNPTLVYKKLLYIICTRHTCGKVMPVNI